MKYVLYNQGDVIYLVSDLDETGWALGKVKAKKPHQGKLTDSPLSLLCDPHSKKFLSIVLDEKIGLFPVEFVRHVDESKKENRSEANEGILLLTLH